MIISIPKTCFYAIALLLSLALQRCCAFTQIHTPSPLSVNAYRNSNKPLHKNAPSKQQTNDTISKEIPCYEQAQPVNTNNHVKTQKHIALITLVVIVASTIVRLTSIICKKFFEIDQLSHEIKAQNTRINKFERNSELNRDYIDDVVALLRNNVDGLRQKMDNEIENKNQEIDLLKAQARNNQQKQQYKLKSGSK